ncbi:Rok-like winged helix domain-containing protein [Priestia megaterium]|uniref:Rok-like winged helix domain-containing protein n=1 Tax=Priestia megaterium TaxID=1404 RepID=UPI00211B9B06|nr:hypothetical protein [Priestia megaterium]
MVFDEREAIKKRMDQIFERTTLLHSEFVHLFDRLRQLDEKEKEDKIAEIIKQYDHPYDKILLEIKRILRDSPIPMRASILRERIEENGVEIKHKNFSSLMNELMKKDKKIKRVNRGFYEYDSSV